MLSKKILELDYVFSWSVFFLLHYSEDSELSVSTFQIAYFFIDLLFGIPSFSSWSYVHWLEIIIPIVFPSEWEGKKTLHPL